MNNPTGHTGLDVYFRDRLAGHLWLDEKRRFVFRYDADWLKSKEAFPLSVRLPLQAEIYADDLSRPFFSNLLPEAELKRVIARRLQISVNNDYDMLSSIGGECAGAVSVIPAGYKPAVKPGYRLLSDEALHQTVTDLPRRPFFAGVEGMRLSLAGAQNKLPVYMEGEDIFIASGNAPSTHILKPPIKDMEETVENEAFCMTLAQKMGLSTPKVSIRSGLDKLYIIERYDRRRDKDGSILRLHQEDFCQALGFLPDQKYESEGGPSLWNCFTLLAENSVSPAADRLSLLQWTIFNFLVGNADAHAKNLAILFTNRGPRLAPFYDLICTQVYPDLTDKLAMRIGGENRPSWIHPKHWEKFGESVGIKSGFVLNALKEMAMDIMPAARELSKDFSEAHGKCEIIEKVVSIIEKRANS
jgi:serine/threonine-protein kinase HipA